MWGRMIAAQLQGRSEEFTSERPRAGTDSMEPVLGVLLGVCHVHASVKDDAHTGSMAMGAR